MDRHPTPGIDSQSPRPRRRASAAQRLASHSTLNRLELTPTDATAGARYRNVNDDAQAVEAALLETHRRPLREVVLDLDATRRTGGGTVVPFK